jgi:hypothetical protein
MKLIVLALAVVVAAVVAVELPEIKRYLKVRNM